MASNSAFKDVPGIYKITYNNPNSEFDGFIYIGQSNSIYTRMLSYRFGFKYDTGHAAWWATMLKKHDKIDDFDKWFTVEILDTVELDKHDPKLKDILNKLEIQRIAEYDSTNRSHGFNVMRGGSGSLPKMKKNVYARKRTMGKNAHKYTPIFVYDKKSNIVELYTSVVAVKEIVNKSTNQINTAMHSQHAIGGKYIILYFKYEKRKEIVNKLIQKKIAKIQTLKDKSTLENNIAIACRRFIDFINLYIAVESLIHANFNDTDCTNHKDAFKQIKRLQTLRDKIIVVNAKYSTMVDLSIVKTSVNTGDIILWDRITGRVTLDNVLNISRKYDVSVNYIDQMLTGGKPMNDKFAYYADENLRDNAMQHIRKRSSLYKSDVLYFYMKGYFSVSGKELRFTPP